MRNVVTTLERVRSKPNGYQITETLDFVLVVITRIFGYNKLDLNNDRIFRTKIKSN